jgi:hypothetical protein
VVDARPGRGLRRPARTAGSVRCAGAFRHSFANTDAALVLVAGIVAVAALGNRPGGWLAAVSAGIWFDFFLTKPYEHFSITSRTDRIAAHPHPTPGRGFVGGSGRRCVGRLSLGPRRALVARELFVHAVEFISGQRVRSVPAVYRSPHACLGRGATTR